MRFPDFEMSTENFTATFPKLTETTFEITSDETPYYNCIAFAAGDFNQWWWPIKGFWPIEKREETIACFISAFESLDYRVCQDSTFVDGFEKVAIFADTQNKPTHMARFEVKLGKWKSKCGPAQDIAHALHDLEGPDYGTVHTYMERNIP